ncbi:MAG: hypothetical protein HZA11_01675 [Nitrospirae bacterium]|nr:hypothetical protein [Nitrospirota bacterium]
MEKVRTDNNSKESGIALVTALIITVVMLMLIGGMSYLLLKGFQTNIINRKFSSVYEAANGGVEYATGVINSYLTTTNQPADVVVSSGTFADTVGCTGTPPPILRITAKTADGTYTITSNIQCLGSKPIPGYGGALRFPPPPAMAGGGTGGGATKYIFYSIVSRAEETTGPTNIGKTEAIYRVIQ